MDNLSPDFLFDLSSFEHAKLFSGPSVWEALLAIPSYFEGYAFKTKEFPGVTFVNKEQVSVGEGTIVEPGAYIEGPCIIGNNCHVRHGAYIRGNVITGDRCVIGHCTEVKNAIFLDGAKAPHFNYVGDSILGNETNLGAGVICANLRLDKEPIVITIGDKIFVTGMKKLGLILGDDAQVGCNAVANPGTVLGKGALASPCRAIRSKL